MSSIITVPCVRMIRESRQDIDLRLAWKDRVSLGKLAQNATKRPYIDGRRVKRAIEDELGRPVKSCADPCGDQTIAQCRDHRRMGPIMNQVLTSG